jgi:hypothetical protein
MGRSYERDLYSNYNEVGRMEEVLGSNTSRIIGYPQSYFLCIPQMFQENIRRVLQFHPNSSFTLRLTIRCYTVCDADHIGRAV